MIPKMIEPDARIAIAARTAADGLHLAATPTFAIMALATRLFGTGPQMILCAAGHDISGMNGMIWMYLLMSAFHAAPWLKLLANRRGALHPYES